MQRLEVYLGLWQTSMMELLFENSQRPKISFPK